MTDEPASPPPTLTAQDGSAGTGQTDGHPKTKKPRKPRKTRNKAGTSKEAADQRRIAFVQAYIANGRNGTQAAITAGFSPNGADVTAVRLLGDIRTKDLLQELTAGHEAATGLTTENVLREIKRLALFDPRRLFKADGALVPIHELDDDTAAGIASLEQDEITDGFGKEAVKIGTTKKIKLWDKVRALDMASKHLGLFEKDNAQRSENLNLQVVMVAAPGRPS